MNTLLLNMSGVYQAESFCPDDSCLIDLTGIDGTSCYCDSEAIESIRKAVRDCTPEGIHWIDSGDYHYLTYFWLEKIKEPFELLLIDNHTDDQEPAFGPEILSCGGWVSTSRRKLANLKKDWFTRKEFPPELTESGLPIYVSLDKDALCGDYARTDWNQGDMTLEELKNSFGLINRRIIGIDICGELTVSKGATSEDLIINLKTNLELQDFFINLQT